MRELPNAAFPTATRQLIPIRSQPLIRLDRAVRGTCTQAASAAQNGQIALYNNSAQNFIMVVRAYDVGPAAALPVNLLYLPRTNGNPTGTIQPLLPDRAALPGALYKQPGGNAGTPDFVDYVGNAGGALTTNYPIAVILPNYSFCIFSTVQNQAITASFLWECLTPDEFVESYGEYA